MYFMQTQYNAILPMTIGSAHRMQYVISQQEHGRSAASQEAWSSQET